MLLSLMSSLYSFACVGVRRLLWHRGTLTAAFLLLLLLLLLLSMLDVMQPIMLGDAALANKMAAAMLEKGVYVVGFSYPVVPKGTARIRVQLSAAHEKEHLDKAIAAFKDVGKQLRVIE
jgi:7-keto-8-aminopelargonate synthetase-like enzyme